MASSSSHNLHDIFEVSDWITVLRLGQRVALFERSETSQQEVVHAITAGTLSTCPGWPTRSGRGMTTKALPPGGAPSGETSSSDEAVVYLHDWWQGVKYGELGSLPIILGLGVIVVVFGILDDTFLTERNFTNLLLQMAAIATIAIEVVFVLLIGEIDLSVAFVGAVGGVVMTLLLRPDDPGWPGGRRSARHC